MKAIFTKYLPQTNTKPSRVRASDSDGNAITVSYYSDDMPDVPHNRAALALCRKMGWTGKLAQGGLSNGGQVFVWTDGSDLLEVK